ncbi:MAG: hypothetical protein COC09_00275 [Gammaproteobacteria bacterium]|nr:hypothetical protein [Gammaproteobacteria bacterium]PCH64948.1 MAG: hypothetical protein COC09_00275 [Gammaproteobacteria bacterium]
MLNYKAIFILLMFAPITAYAGLDSYSFVHVTIETPWAIFIFLCFLVLAPFVLMAILYWHFALKRHGKKNKAEVETK